MVSSFRYALLGLMGITALAIGCADVLDYGAIGFEKKASSNLAQCGSVMTSTPSCAACADAHCCVPTGSCGRDTDCIALLSCRGECNPSDEACLDRCISDYPNAVSKYIELQSCLTNSCSDVCSGTVQPIPDIPQKLDGSSGSAGAPQGTTCGNDCAEEMHSECTCSPADPCGWSSDGYCDSWCATEFPTRHFDDGDDCKSGGTDEPAQEQTSQSEPTDGAKSSSDGQ